MKLPFLFQEHFFLQKIIESKSILHTIVFSSQKGNACQKMTLDPLLFTRKTLRKRRKK